MTQDTENFTDTLVIYFCDEDKRWIAHGLHTDQIGDGDSIIAAIEDAIHAIDAVAMIVRDDPTVEFFREADDEIQQMARTAKPLPREIYEIAHRRARGFWPDDLTIDFKPTTSASFKTEIRERERQEVAV